MVRLALQQRQRLLRDGLAQLITARDNIEVVGAAVDAPELLSVCKAQRPEVVLVEADGAEWDVARLTASVQRSLPKARIIGIAQGSPAIAEVNRLHRSGMATLVPRSGGIAPIIAAIENRPGQRHCEVVLKYPVAATVRPTLTTREATILNLVGAGFTSRGIAARLEISHKTVENHKQRIFAKLGVQSQAHAVSVAMRSGMLDPEMVMGLAIAD